MSGKISRRKICWLGIYFCILVISVLLFEHSIVFAYDRSQATRYAEKWIDAAEQAQLRNTGGESNFDDQWPFHDYPGADCANFVSQCLIAGGLNLLEGDLADDRHAIVNCNYLYLNLNSYQGYPQHTRIEYVDGTEQAPRRDSYR